jgi:ABC-type arginine/histidine transport system permease subunit
MDGSAKYGRLWLRGLWVFLMLIVINVVVGMLGAGVAALLRTAIAQPLVVAYVVVLLVVGFPFMGWLFEQLASRLPRV